MIMIIIMTREGRWKGGRFSVTLYVCAVGIQPFCTRNPSLNLSPSQKKSRFFFFHLSRVSIKN